MEKSLVKISFQWRVKNFDLEFALFPAIIFSLIFSVKDKNFDLEFTLFPAIIEFFTHFFQWRVKKLWPWVLPCFQQSLNFSFTFSVEWKKIFFYQLRSRWENDLQFGIFWICNLGSFGSVIWDFGSVIWATQKVKTCQSAVAWTLNPSRISNSGRTSS